MSKVIIYPTFDTVYYSFYIQGIIEVFGKSGVHFSSRSFPPIPSAYLAFIITGKKDLRVVVDAYDGGLITDDSGLEWCDIYGKVNLTMPAIPKHFVHKCFPIGPSFSVQVWSPVQSWWVALKNYRFSVDYHAGNGVADFRLSSPRLNSSLQHFANYRRQYKYRLSVGRFAPGLSRDDYIFFLSSYWQEKEAPGTSEHRAFFIESCRSIPGINFEGGFAPFETERLPDRFARYTAQRVSFSEYLEKTKASALVFNTPAVWSCHGWKLAEFLALGKAIISTPLTNELAPPLIHGQHIHYVDGSLDSIRAAVHLLLSDRQYRKQLERNAYDYYVSFLSPKRVIERLLCH